MEYRKRSGGRPPLIVILKQYKLVFVGLFLSVILFAALFSGSGSGRVESGDGASSLSSTASEGSATSLAPARPPPKGMRRILLVQNFKEAFAADAYLTELANNLIASSESVYVDVLAANVEGTDAEALGLAKSPRLRLLDGVANHPCEVVQGGLIVYDTVADVMANLNERFDYSAIILFDPACTALIKTLYEDHTGFEGRVYHAHALSNAEENALPLPVPFSAAVFEVKNGGGSSKCVVVSGEGYVEGDEEDSALSNVVDEDLTFFVIGGKAPKGLKVDKTKQFDTAKEALRAIAADCSVVVPASPTVASVAIAAQKAVPATMSKQAYSMLKMDSGSSMGKKDEEAVLSALVSASPPSSVADKSDSVQAQLAQNEKSAKSSVNTFVDSLYLPAATSPGVRAPQSPVVSIVVGVRPNLMKAAPIIAAINKMRPGWEVELVHTGQHTDKMMSTVFFQELGIKKPDRYLGVGGGSMLHQVAMVIDKLSELYTTSRPSAMMVLGDVTSTTAASAAAIRLGIPLIHYEAGLRSHDRTMPEEINRMETDSIADAHFVTEPDGIKNLEREGKGDTIYFTGNVMIDTLLENVELMKAKKVFKQYSGLEEKKYIAVTLHRAANVDTEYSLKKLVKALTSIAAKVAPVVFPVHPRTKKSLERFSMLNELKNAENVYFVEPLGPKDFSSLVLTAGLVITDSGGVTEESSVLGVPTITVRPNTERPVTVTQGTNELAPNDPDVLFELAKKAMDGKWKTGREGGLQGWDGKAAERVVEATEAVLCYPAVKQSEKLHRDLFDLDDFVEKLRSSE
uniref:UDP-N-acetylglucosamine 2-epimerase domain-containing protein n=1 Tax=Palpitomonas bilix TaxID=652834 RepID=A0A7S3GMI1_9EUKA|mmetsp:Transcript_978/g.1997  ORF Transcript_978/g.1997 Transcript_978/m.1997 type:complete len:800 (+) Transcript_978:128-2527(+)